MLGNAVAREVPGRRATHRRWLRLAPSDGAIGLLEVEAPIDVDPEDWPKRNEDYVVVAAESFASLDAALLELERRGVDTDEFDAIWKTQNPF